MQDRGLVMPGMYQVSSLLFRTHSPPSQSQPTAFYDPDHARFPVVDRSPNDFQMEVARMRKKAYETSLV